MTDFFVSKFNKEHKCAHCKHSKLKVGLKIFSLCQDHLAVARQRWRNWASERKDAGKCCFCDCKSYCGWLRCKKHTAINRKRIREWILTHPWHYKEQWEKKKKLKESGFCPYCKEHRRLNNGLRTCDPCLTRRRELYKNQTSKHAH